MYCTGYIQGQTDRQTGKFATEYNDEQTNIIICILFVCLSSSTGRGGSQTDEVAIEVNDGQTNWIKFIPFVCPSDNSLESESVLHHHHHP